MKTITKVYQVYTIDELPKEAQEKALKEWVNNNDYYFLSHCMNEKLHELLEENGIKDTNDTSKPGTKPTQVQYSLSYSQGDGAMFAGDFVFTHDGKPYNINVKHAGHYYHYNSKTFHITDPSSDDQEQENYEEIEKAFNEVYMDICKGLERYGYDFIEYENSMESFIEACNANDYTFTIDGEMDNSK